MKTTFRFTLALLVAVSLSTLSIVSTSSAIEPGQNACTTLPIAQTNYQSKSEERLAKMNEDFSKRIDNINNRDNTVDPKVDAARATADAKFDQAITTLLADPDLTEAQIKAINTYKTQVLAAEETREGVVDEARTTYRSSLVEVVNQHQASLSAATAEFQTSVSDAFTIAIANCSDSTVRATLKSDIAEARKTLTTARQSAQVTEQIKELVEVRNTSVKAADTEFATSVAAYSAALATVLGVTIDTTP